MTWLIWIDFKLRQKYSITFWFISLYIVINGYLHVLKYLESERIVSKVNRWKVIHKPDCCCDLNWAEQHWGAAPQLTHQPGQSTFHVTLQQLFSFLHLFDLVPRFADISDLIHSQNSTWNVLNNGNTFKKETVCALYIQIQSSSLCSKWTIGHKLQTLQFQSPFTYITEWRASHWQI